jgi:hypothetical protein
VGKEKMRLIGAITAGSGLVNEDGYGMLGSSDDVTAAWIFDGVTGINDRAYLPAESDAQWLVARADMHLHRLAGTEAGLDEILSDLVAQLIGDWSEVSAGLDLPASYDPPAACLILVKRYGHDWKALRLGDSCLLASYAEGDHRIFAASPNNAFDHWLSGEARKRRDAGILDVKALLTEFRPQLMAGRQKRNQSGGYSILEADPAALTMAEHIDLGQPEGILLCTDGYYRAVDHYGLHEDAALVAASLQPGGVERVLGELRAIEASDPECQVHLRFKPSDDATAVGLMKNSAFP